LSVRMPSVFCNRNIKVKYSNNFQKVGRNRREVAVEKEREREKKKIGR
jgi:hypothetical protein